MDSPSMSSTNTVDPANWVDQHGDYLFRYAMRRLANTNLAEELVQDTFLSALSAVDQFKGQSSERTWLVSILKNKIIDHFRRKGRTHAVNETDLDNDAALESLFTKKGNWREGPAPLRGDPVSILEKKEFWGVFQICLDGLPSRWADAFSLREIDQLSTEEASKALSITPQNLFVVLHRARMRLLRCLEANWFSTSD